MHECDTKIWNARVDCTVYATCFRDCDVDRFDVETHAAQRVMRRAVGASAPMAARCFGLGEAIGHAVQPAAAFGWPQAPLFLKKITGCR